MGRMRLRLSPPRQVKGTAALRLTLLVILHARLGKPALRSINGLIHCHSLCVQGEVLYIFLISANEKQWKANQATLKSLIPTFKA